MYQVVQLPKDCKYGNLEHRLYELTNMADYGVMKNPLNDFYPNPTYYQKLIDNNTIALYNNWMAMALPDVFCVLMAYSNKAFIYEPWENSRFKLFLNTILLKNYLITCNTTYQKVSVNRDFEYDFVEFDRAFNLRTISYNIVPQYIYEKMRRALEIDEELSIINAKITNYREKQDKRSDRRQAIILFCVALLAVTSAFADGVTLCGQLGFISEHSSDAEISHLRVGCVVIFLVLIAIIVGCMLQSTKYCLKLSKIIKYVQKIYGQK